MNQGQVVVVFVADKSGYMSGAKDVQARSKQLSQQLDADTQAATDRMSDRFSALGGAIGTALKAGGIAAGVGLAASIKLAGDFEQSLNILKSVTGATGDQMVELSAKARALGQDVALPGVSASDAAQAMTELGKAGLNVNDILAASKGVLSLAKAGQIEVSDAATIASQALNAFKLKGEDATKVADILAAGSNASAASVEGMALGLQQSAAVAGQFGVSLQDTVTALAIFANRGIQGSDAGTSLKTMLIALANPSKEAADLMKKLGIRAFDAKGQFVGLEGLAGSLQKGLKGLTQEQQNAALATIFGTDAFRAAAFLADSAGKSYQDMSKAVGKAGAATDLAAAQNSGFNGALDNLKSTLETIGTDLGTKLLPPLTEFLRVLAANLNPAVDWLIAHGKTLAIVLGSIASAFAVIRVAGFISDLGKAQKTLDLFIGAKNANGIRALGTAFKAVGSGALTATKFIGSLTATVVKNTAVWTANAARVTALAVAQAAVRTATIAWTAAQWLLNAALNANPISLIIIAIAALAAGIALLWANSETFRNIVTGAFNAVWGVIQAVWNWVSQNWPLLLAILTGPIGVAILTIIQNWDTIKQFFANLWGAIRDTATSVWNGLTGFFVGVWNTVSGAVSGAWNGIRNAVAGGVNSVVGFVRSLPGGILSALGNLGALLINAGHDLIIGFVKGMGNASGAVVNKIKDICKGALDAVKSFFGIHSPSRVMEKMGDFWGQGFAGGIKGSVGAIMSAVDTVNGGIIGAFTDPLTPTFAASGNVSMSAEDIWGKGTNGSTSSGDAKVVQNNYLTNGVTVDQVNRSLITQIRRG